MATFGYAVAATMAAVSARREVVCSYVYGCCASQNRINVSAFPMAPRIFFWPLSSHLAYPGFSEQCAQCEQQDNQHCEQNEEQCTLVIRDEKLTPPGTSSYTTGNYC